MTASITVKVKTAQFAKTMPQMAPPAADPPALRDWGLVVVAV
jgi:hypothetical protein